PGGAQHHALRGGGVLPQDRMLLFLAPALSPRRGARYAGALLHRSLAPQAHRAGHACVHLLRRVLARDPTLSRSQRESHDMAKAHAPDTSHYFIPHGSPWPIRASIALFVMMLGAVGYLNDWAGAWV